MVSINMTRQFFNDLLATKYCNNVHLYNIIIATYVIQSTAVQDMKLHSQSHEADIYTPEIQSIWNER